MLGMTGAGGRPAESVATTHPAGPIRAALYLRTESPAGEIGRSMPRLRRLALDQGLQVRPEDILVDAGYPGATAQRPAFQTLCARVRAGEIEAIVVGAVAALAETLAAYETLRHAAAGRPVAIYEFTGPGDPCPLRRRALGDIADDIAALERRGDWRSRLADDAPAPRYRRSSG